MALQVLIKPRALRQIEKAAAWWTENRPAAPGAIREDLESAFELLRYEPGVGTQIDTSRSAVVRRLYLSRVGYFVYYRVRGRVLEVVAFWHSSRGSVPAF